MKPLYLVVAMVTSGCVMHVYSDAKEPREMYVDKTPPAVEVPFAPPRGGIEPVPSAPGKGHGWVPGHWVWNDGRYVWVKGRWVATTRDWVWIPPRCATGKGKMGGHIDFTPGHFKKEPQIPKRSTVTAIPGGHGIVGGKQSDKQPEPSSSTSTGVAGGLVNPTPSATVTATPVPSASTSTSTGTTTSTKGKEKGKGKAERPDRNETEQKPDLMPQGTPPLKSSAANAKHNAKVKASKKIRPEVMESELRPANLP